MINKPNGTGIKRVLKAAHCSYKGFKAAFTYESAFRQELILCLILFPLSFLIANDIASWLILVTSMLFLLFAELVNSALEALADKITTEHDELIGRAKDIGSACVFIALVILLLAWSYAIFAFFIGNQDF
jgi:diacylglycerol kinase (ATP)